MNIGKRIMCTIFIISLFVLAGCAQDTIVTTSESPYSGGSKGIIAEFLALGVYNDNSRMEEVFEGETFPIEVMLSNKGEEEVDINMATVTLKGISLNDFLGIATDGVLSNTEIIEKVTEFNLEGGETTLDFTPGTEDATYLVDLTGAFYDVSIFAELIYRYKTHAAVPQVCFKENPREEGICEVEESKKVYSSGAPIQVKSAEEKRAGTGKIAIEFKIENVGGGEVAKPGAEFDIRYDQLSFTSSDADLWECKSAGKVNEGRFDSSGKMIIVCKLKAAMDENDLYTKELDLTLEYDYKELIQRQIRIREQ